MATGEVTMEDLVAGESTMEDLVEETASTESVTPTAGEFARDVTALLTEAVITKPVRSIQRKQVVLVSEHIVYPKQGVRVA